VSARDVARTKHLLDNAVTEYGRIKTRALGKRDPVALRQRERIRKLTDKLIDEVKPADFGPLLDKAVMREFPGTICETTFNIFSMRRVTSWRDAKTGSKYPAAKARRIKDFVTGYMAAYGEVP
jgi:hypothetical protein